MFLGFLLYLRDGGFKVSLKDWLTLIEGLQMGLHNQSLRGFYILSRALLVKTETDLDKYEELFDSFFGKISSEQLEAEISELASDMQRAQHLFADYMGKKGVTPQAVAMALEDRAEAIVAVEAADGAADEEVSHIRGQQAGGSMIQGAGGKSIVHAKGDRRFRDWRTDCTIESRQFQMAFRLLRELSRKLETSEEELDIKGTIEHTCKRGGILDIRMQPPRKNRLKVMVLIDSGGSMKPYEELCSLLFQSLNKANTFSDLKIYYFHNCVEGELYKDPSIDPDETVRTEWVLRNISADYKVIFVGDADMSRYELETKWFERFREKYKKCIWLHPQEKEENIAWMSESFIEIDKIFPMFRLSIDGLKDGMYRLMRDS
ncbi:MAG: hypothetical protein Q4F78_08180 [Bacillota bacterium]|nr:hypothetical protein [Bacillota bacterium]